MRMSLIVQVMMLGLLSVSVQSRDVRNKINISSGPSAKVKRQTSSVAQEIAKRIM